MPDPQALQVAFLSSDEPTCGIAEVSRKLSAAMPPWISLCPITLPKYNASLTRLGAAAKEANACDLIHVQHEYAFFGGPSAARYLWPQFVARLRRPYLVTLHTRWPLASLRAPAWRRTLRALRRTWDDLSGWTGYLRSRQFANARAIITHAPDFTAQLLHDLPWQKIFTLPLGVSWPRKPLDKTLLPELSSCERPWVTLFGFINPAKGHAEALDAWRKYSGPGTLVIAGQAGFAQDQSYARKILNSAGRMPGRVRVLPALSEESKNTLLEQTDLALLPYQSVTASAVFAEWMSAGKPTLASDLPYFSTIAEKYHCLALYQRKRSGDLLAQITLLLENANRAHQLAAHAHEYARMHAWPNIAYQTAEIYAEIWRGIQAERQV